MREATNGKYPRYALYENVEGIYSSNRGADFKLLLETIIGVKESGVQVPAPKKGRWPRADLYLGDGWSVAYRTFDAMYWGVPQRRARIYLIADFASDRAGEILFERKGVPRDSSEGCFSWQEITRGLEDSIRETIAYGISRPGFASGEKANFNFAVDEELSPTITATGPNAVGIMNKPLTYDIRFTSEGTRNARGHCYETEISRCLDTSESNPDSNHGGICVLQGSMIGRKDKNGPRNGFSEDICYALNTMDTHAICVPIYCATTGSFMAISEETANTLNARDWKDPQIVNVPEYVVRRLTPTECARLQGFPDTWCRNLETLVPSDDEMKFWREVWDTWASLNGKKLKSDKQIRKWLANPYSDNEEYKLWGNGVALPCAYFVLKGITSSSE